MVSDTALAASFAGGDEAVVAELRGVVNSTADAVVSDTALAASFAGGDEAVVSGAADLKAR